MVSHCANPDCRVPFHHLRGGRLYRFEIRSPQSPCADVPNVICSEKPSRATVFFWMCVECCRKFGLKFDSDNGIQLVPLKGPFFRSRSPVHARDVHRAMESMIATADHQPDTLSASDEDSEPAPVCSVCGS